jgi:hypothetical protein
VSIYTVLNQYALRRGTQLTAKTGKPSWVMYVMLVGLLLATILLVIFQVSTANTATKTESALFSVLQFIFSLAFAWLLSRLVTEQQFIESQRKFAIGAFRRIREIERSLNRAQKYISSAEGRAGQEGHSDFAVVRAGLLNAQDAVRSSIADWADIIGDEIEVTNEIRRLKQLKSDADEAPVAVDLGRKDSQGGQSLESDIRLNSEIQRLTSALSAEMRADIEVNELNGVEGALYYLSDEWRKKRSLEFNAFWEPRDSFSGGLDEINVGSSVYIAKGIKKNRDTALLVYDSGGNWIAVVTNLCPNCSYDDFITAVGDFYGSQLIPKSFGGDPLVATVIAMKEYDGEVGRRYFRIVMEVQPDILMPQGLK